ncbi:MAG: hypothetical protein WCT44_03545 [Candidatus Paceibacterota bacterium]
MLSTQAKKEIKHIEEKPNKVGLTREDNQKLVDVFALLIKVDKRISPHLYKPNNATND